MTTQVARLMPANGTRINGHHAEEEAQVEAVLLRLDALRGSAANRVRVAERVREINEELEASNVPIRIRVVR